MEVRRMKPRQKLSVLEKKIKPNPRYSKVEPVIDTGSNLRTELEKLEEIHQLYKFRNDEIFRRITVNNLVGLMVEVCKLEHQLSQGQPEEDELEPIQDVTSNDDIVPNLQDNDQQEDIDTLIRSQFNERRQESAASSVQRRGTSRSVTSLVRGVGEMDDEADVSASVGPVLLPGAGGLDGRPFLILDVRDHDQYSRGHIVLAKSYPAIRLNRAFDYEIPEMVALKNKPNSIIVVYDDDESIANRCATTLTQRGYDNAFMLSGGMRVAALKFPETLITDREEKEVRNQEIDCGLEEGDIIVLEKLLEENIQKGSSRMMYSRQGGPITGGSRRSSSLDRGSVARKFLLEGTPVRTSTALDKR